MILGPYNLGSPRTPRISGPPLSIMYRGLTLCYNLLLVISVLPLQSDATSIIHVSRQLANESPPLAELHMPLQIPPSPSPSPASPAPAPIDLANKGPYVTMPNAEPVDTETCDRIFRTCHVKRITACVGLEGSMLLVRNNDNTSLKVNVTILPVNVTYKEIDIPRHQAKKINISDSFAKSSSIVLEVEKGHCIIHMGAFVPNGNISLRFPSVDTYITPVNGACAVFAVVLIIGGTWTGFEFWKRRRHPEGVPYQELEIGHSKSVSSANVEAAEGWDQVWDDHWDEEIDV